MKTSIEASSERLIERQKRLNKRRLNESWKRKLKKIETSSFRILKKRFKINSFYDEISSKFEDESSDEENIIEIHSIATASFNILFRQKDVEIFIVFMKNLKIQLKKEDSNTMIDSKSVISSEYHDFLDIFSKEKTNILSSHRKHDHEFDYEYASFYNLSKEELQLVKKYLKEHLNKNFIESSIAFYNC